MESDLSEMEHPTTVAENQADEDDDEDDGSLMENFEPSISDRLQVGYSSMDRASQTDLSEILNLKELSKVLGIVVNDIATLKKSLYYAKLTLQAEYDGRLSDVTLELYARVNQRIAEIEGIHQERIQVVRKSYKTQLANALCKLSRDYHNFYGNKDALNEDSHKKKLKEMQKNQSMMRKNEMAQQEMFEILKLQMEDSKSKEVEIPSRKSSVISTTHFTDEIDELKKSIKNFESRVDYLEDMLEETNVDNNKLNSDVDELNSKLYDEQKKALALNDIIASTKVKMEKEREKADERLTQQHEKLTREMEKKLSVLREQHQQETDNQLQMAKHNEAERLRRQKLTEEKRIKDLMEQHEQDKVIVEVPQDTDLSRLQLIERKQRAEIARLNKDIERTTRLSQIQVKVLNEHIHSLKDEMFIRTTLQRQSAKLNQATLTWVKRGTNCIPLGVTAKDDTKPIRKLKLPNIIGALLDDDSDSLSKEEIGQDC